MISSRRKGRLAGLRLIGLVVVSALATGALVQTSPVADAASKGDLAAVSALLAKGADVNAPMGDGMTALHWAAENVDTAMTRILLAAGAGVKATTRIGNYTALMIAARNGSGPVVRALLAAGADVSAITTSGATALHMAAGSGSVDAVSALLDKGADVNAREAEWEQTPLIFAAAYDRADVIKLLLQRGANHAHVTRAMSLSEQSAMDNASSRRRNEVLNEIRGRMRDSVGDSTARVEPTPQQMQDAIAAGRAALLEQLNLDTTNIVEEVDTAAGQVAGYASSVGAIGGLTALHHAVRQGNLTAVGALIEGGADLNPRTSGDGTTPLLMATINGQFDAAMMLLKAGADPKIASGANATPLYTVINTQWAPRSRFPQPQAVQNQETNYLDLMEALLKAGADPNVRLSAHLWYFAFSNCGNANCGLENLEGTTPFWRAAYSVDVDAMKLLMAHGADPKIPSQRAAGGGGRGGGGGGRGGRGGGGGRQGGRAGQAAQQAQGADQGGLASVIAGLRADAGRGGAGTAGDSSAGRGGAQAADTAATAAVASARGGRGARGGGGGGARGGGGGARGGGGGGGGAAAPLSVTDSLAREAPAGVGVYPIHAAAGVGYGNGFAGNSHRHAPEGWMPAMKYLVEELGADVNERDASGYTPLHHAAARGDNEMIEYLVSKGADPKAVARNGRTTVDMANGPVQRLKPFPETIKLLEGLGAINNHRCVGC